MARRTLVSWQAFALAVDSITETLVRALRVSMSRIRENVIRRICHQRVALRSAKWESRGTFNLEHIVARKLIVSIKISKRDINMRPAKGTRACSIREDVEEEKRKCKRRDEWVERKSSKENNLRREQSEPWKLGSQVHISFAPQLPCPEHAFGHSAEMIVTPDATISEAIAFESFIRFNYPSETLFGRKHFELFGTKCECVIQNSVWNFIKINSCLLQSLNNNVSLGTRCTIIGFYNL